MALPPHAARVAVAQLAIHPAAMLDRRSLLEDPLGGAGGDLLAFDDGLRDRLGERLPKLRARIREAYCAQWRLKVGAIPSLSASRSHGARRRGLDLVGAVSRVQRRPERGPGGTELSDQLVGHLAQRLGLDRQRLEQVAAIDAAPGEGHPRVGDLVVLAAREEDRLGAEAHLHLAAAP